jgi:hypothetical protein
VSAQRTTNKFDGLLQRDRRAPAAPHQETPAVNAPTPPGQPDLAGPTTTLASSPPPVPAKAADVTAKRGNPDYANLTVYIRQSTRRAVKLRMAHLDNPPEWSVLVDELLAGWAAQRSTP